MGLKTFLVGGVALFWLPIFAIGKDISHDLPYPSKLYHAVQFWKLIYTQHDTSQGVVHDSEDLSIIYTPVRLKNHDDFSSVDQLKNSIRTHLFNIVRKKGRHLTSAERRVLDVFSGRVTGARLLRAAENIRFQRGMKDSFLKGLIDSGYYLSAIEKIFKRYGLPDFLKYLPHVESAFQQKAFSKFGAAGLWQLMPETGAQYLRIGYEVDERLDPWKATEAAAQYLKQNWSTLKSWPLALTAYNHGAWGVGNAVKTLDTTQIDDIAFNYSGPSFGFASRNFYAQFLAVVEITKNPSKYFGSVKFKQPLEFEEIQMKRPVYFREIINHYKVDLGTFKFLNPGLRPPVLENQRPIPTGITVRVPPHSRQTQYLVAALDQSAIAIDSVDKISEWKPQKLKEVRSPAKEIELRNDQYRIFDAKDGKGRIEIRLNETLIHIAEWAHIEPNILRRLNDLDDHAQVRLGQKLLIPIFTTSVPEFERARLDYHQKIKEDFFSRFDVYEMMPYTVRSGENLWSICYQKFDIPPWLLYEYNQTVSLQSLKPGINLQVPLVREKAIALAEESGS